MVKKTKKMLAIEAKYGRPFWQIVDRMARRGMGKAEVADELGFTHSHFYRMVARHPDPIEWKPPAQTLRAQATRHARRGICTPGLREAMDKARAVQREHRVYDLAGFVGTIPEHAARQGLPISTVRSRRLSGWSLSEALGYSERSGSKRGHALCRVEREYGKPFIDVLRDFARQGCGVPFVAAALSVHESTVRYHIQKAGGWDALGFKKNTYPVWTDRTAQQASWLKTKGRMLEHDGRTMHLAAWAQETGISATTISHRLSNGWSVADALTIPTGARRPGGRPRKQPQNHEWRTQA